MDAKVSTNTKTMPVQKIFRYIRFLFAKTCTCKIKKRSMDWKEILKIKRSATNHGMTTKSKEMSKCILNIDKVSKGSKIGLRM